MVQLSLFFFLFFLQCTTGVERHQIMRYYQMNVEEANRFIKTIMAIDC